ncbi:10923_t:CDS:1, partial [Racocetra fulgida]
QSLQNLRRRVTYEQAFGKWVYGRRYVLFYLNLSIQLTITLTIKYCKTTA